MRRFIVLSTFWLVLLSGVSFAGYLSTIGRTFSAWLVLVLFLSIAGILARYDHEDPDGTD